jgi:Caspase domain/Domain of unknown function (DUF4384)
MHKFTRGVAATVLAWTACLAYAGDAPTVVTNPNAHALIMTIGNYQGNIPKLNGVAFDAATAKEISHRMGVPAGNIHALKDNQLTLDGMRKAFDDLEARLGGNEQVFIYYSGHGGRQLVQEESGERCAESLVTVDGQGFTDVELEGRLKALSQKAQKTVFFLDACHSGGATTRSINTTAGLYSAKSYSPSELGCSKPTNILTRSIILSKVPGSGGANFVHIAAARDNEVSLDQPGKGGVASQAWLACMSGAAKDVDGSGGLSAEEMRLCAQTRIDEQLKDAKGYLPHHVSLSGNSAMVLSYASSEPAMASSPVIDKPSAIAALQDIYNSRDDRRLTTLTAPTNVLKIGSDYVDLTLSSREGGYVYLLMAGSDGQTFDLLFPNQLDKSNQIAANSSVQLPRPSWQLAASGPPGKNTLLAVVSDSPRDFTTVGLKPAGPFSTISALGAKDIQLVTSGATKPADIQCASNPTTRNLSIQKRCSSGYSAAVITLEEVR